MPTLDEIQRELNRPVAPQEMLDRAERCRTALAQIERTTDPMAWASAQALLGMKLVQIRTKDRPECLEQAIEAYQKALETFSPEDAPGEWIQTTGNLALAYRDRVHGVRGENLRLAITYFEQLLEIFSLAQMSLEWARTKGNLALVYRDLSNLEDRAENLEKAIEGFKAALEIFKRDEHPREWAWATMLLGGAYDMRVKGVRRDNVEEAIHCFESALGVYTSKDTPDDWATTKMNLGTAYQHRVAGLPADNLELAIQNYVDALDAFNKGKNRLSWAQTQMNLGNAYRRRIRGDATQNLEMAIQAHKESLGALTEQDRPDWALTMMNLGDAYFERRLGRRAENLQLAAQAYENALKSLSREEEPRRWANARMNLGNIYSQIAGGLNAAVQCYQDALEIFQPEKDPEKWLQAKINLATAYLQDTSPNRAQSVEQSIMAFQQVLSALTRDDRPAEWANTQRNLATAYRVRAMGVRQDNLMLAVEGYRKALEVYTPEAWPRQHMKTQRSMGELFFGERRWREAASAFNEAIADHDRLYRAAPTLEARQTELRDIRFISEVLAYSLGQVGDLQEAVLAIERGRARAMVELLALEEAPLNKVRPDDRKAFEEVRGRIRELLAEDRLPEETPSRRDFLTLSQELGRAYGELDALTERIQGYVPEFLPSVGFADIQQAASTCPLVYVMATEAGGLGLAVDGKRGGDLSVIWLPELTERNLQDHLRAYVGSYSAWRAATEDETKRENWFRTLDETLQWLWDAAMGRLVEAISGSGRAVLVPAGPLGLLPMHAAWTPAAGTPTGRHYALDSLAFQYAPSARTLLSALKSAPQRSPSALLAVDEPSPVSASFLPNSEYEVKSASSYFDSSCVLRHEAATRQALLEEMRKYPVFHFSCHGLARMAEPLESGLVMANDEFLSLRDLLDLRLEHTRLAALSACETGLPGAELPDEVVSLPAGLVQAGVAGTLASLWSVSDLSTALLMVRFYEMWRKDALEPAEALQKAQQWMTSTATQMKLADWYERKYEASHGSDPDAFRMMTYYQNNPNAKPFEHPYFWAGLFFTGV